MSFSSRLHAFVTRLWAASIWHPQAVDPEEWKYRNLMRLWLPMYDLLAILAGIWAMLFGSPILHRLLGDDGYIDLVGGALAVISAVCLVGVVFPALARLEAWGKQVLVGLLGAYAGAIVIFNASGDITSWFVSFIVLMTLPLPLFRLAMLGEEKKESREDQA
jgi:hypothetical protein